MSNPIRPQMLCRRETTLLTQALPAAKVGATNKATTMKSLAPNMPKYLLKNEKAFAPRARQPGEATAPGTNLFARENYDPALHGERRQAERDGQNDHLKHLSLPPQPGAVYRTGHL